MINQKIVRQQMGQNFFGIEEWLVFFNKKFSYAQRKVMNFPWDENILNGPCPFFPEKRIKETHFAFFGGMPLTINEIRREYPESQKNKVPLGQKYYCQQQWMPTYLSAERQPCFYPEENFNKESFCNEKLQVRWYLMPIAAAFRGTEKSIPHDYTIATAVEEVIKNLFYFHKTGKYIHIVLGLRGLRCKDVTSTGKCITVGFWLEGRGLEIAAQENYYDQWDYNYGGFALSRI